MRSISLWVPTTEWAEVGGGGGKSKLYHRVMGTRLVNVLECVPSSVFWYPSQHYGDRCAYDYLIIEHTFLSHINRLCYKALIWIFSKKKKIKDYAVLLEISSKDVCISDNHIHDATYIACPIWVINTHLLVGVVALTFKGILHIFYTCELNTGYTSESSGKFLINPNSLATP